MTRRAASLGPPLAVVVAAAVAAACSSGGGANPALTASAAPASPSAQRLDPGPTCVPPVPPKPGACLSLAPPDSRVDLTAPTFSNPTAVTNPLHPSARTDQVIYGGQVGGAPFRTEFSRLPERKRITWQGRSFDGITMQYLAFSGGRIEEVALDWFAQADDGSVWYLGENVYDYEDGAVADTEGTWVAGPKTPAAMIMPAHPKPGDAYRTENAPPVVFEEVRVRATDQTIPGPSGPVAGALVVRETHLDGETEDKVFAPGYGEFSTGSANGDLEAVSLAMPTDRRPGPAPATLGALTAAVAAARTAAAGGESPPQARVDALRRAWAAHRATGVPPLLDRQTERDVAALASAVRAGAADDAREALLRIAQDELDLRLPYADVASVDQARARLWAGQVAVDAAAGDDAGVLGDVAAFEWTWRRVGHLAPEAARAKVEALAEAARAAAERHDPAAAMRTSAALVTALPT